MGDKVCKSNDELKLERDESSDFNVLMTCYSRDLWCACAHIFQKRKLGELFGAGALNTAYMRYFLKIENYVCIRITCIYTPLYALLYRLRVVYRSKQLLLL